MDPRIRIRASDPWARARARSAQRQGRTTLGYDACAPHSSPPSRRLPGRSPPLATSPRPAPPRPPRLPRPSRPPRLPRQTGLRRRDGPGRPGPG
eukprot:scaffold114830_cov30-Phaeocystis_antarctica.AAC.1